MIRIETLHKTNGPEKTDVLYNIVQTIICGTVFRSSLLSAYGQTIAVWVCIILYILFISYNWIIIIARGNYVFAAYVHAFCHRNNILGTGAVYNGVLYYYNCRIRGRGIIFNHRRFGICKRRSPIS